MSNWYRSVDLSYLRCLPRCDTCSISVCISDRKIQMQFVLSENNSTIDSLVSVVAVDYSTQGNFQSYRVYPVPEDAIVTPNGFDECNAFKKTNNCGWPKQAIRTTVSHEKALHVNHDDVIKWKHFPRYWAFVRGIQRFPVNSPHKGQWRGALMFPLICTWTNGWANSRDASDLRRHRAHYDIIVMWQWKLHLDSLRMTSLTEIHHCFL